MPPKVPSPVNNSLRLGSGSGNGNGHHANGLGNGVPSSNSGNNTPNNNTTLSSIISSLSNMNLEREGRRDSDRGGRLSPSSMLGLSDIMGGNGSTSPQPIPRSTTPNSNGLADVFANGGSTSPNSKSDMSKSPNSLSLLSLLIAYCLCYRFVSFIGFLLFVTLINLSPCSTPVHIHRTSDWPYLLSLQGPTWVPLPAEEA